MIKVITWFRRKPGMSVDEFQSYWRNEHPKAVLQLPGLRKYVQNHVVGVAIRRCVSRTWMGLPRPGGTTGLRSTPTGARRRSTR